MPLHSYQYVYDPVHHLHVSITSDTGLRILRHYIQQYGRGTSAHPADTSPFVHKSSSTHTDTVTDTVTGTVTDTEDNSASSEFVPAIVAKLVAPLFPSKTIEHYYSKKQSLQTVDAWIRDIFQPKYVEPSNVANIATNTLIGRGSFGTVNRGTKEGTVVKQIMFQRKRTRKPNLSVLQLREHGSDDVEKEMKLYIIASKFDVGPTVLDCFLSPNSGYIVMEAYTTTLFRYCRRYLSIGSSVKKPAHLTTKETLEQMVLDLFRTSIQQGILMLDMKPDNFLVQVRSSSDGSKVTKVRLTDFDPHFTILMVNDKVYGSSGGLGGRLNRSALSVVEYKLFEDCMCDLFVMCTAGMLIRSKFKPVLLFDSYVRNIDWDRYENILMRLCVSIMKSSVSCKVFQSMENYLVNRIIHDLQYELYVTKYKATTTDTEGVLSYPLIKFIEKVRDAQKAYIFRSDQLQTKPKPKSTVFKRRRNSSPVKKMKTMKTMKTVFKRRRNSSPLKKNKKNKRKKINDE